MNQRPKFRIEKLLLSILIFLPGSLSLASTISSDTSQAQAQLGYAYRSDKEMFVGANCIEAMNTTSPDFNAGAAQAGFTFSQSLTQSQLSDELGFGLNGHASYGVTSYSMAASFYQQSVSNSFSISSSWLSEYTFPNHVIGAAKLSATGQGVSGNDERWTTTCGDEYVSQITYGAKLFFSIRIDFTSEQVKSAFQSKFSISGPAAGVGATLDKASASFGQNATVTITAHQLGGDVSQITKLFGSGDQAGIAPFIQCQLGHFEDCATMLQKFLAYATDVKTGFPSQLAVGASPGGAPLTYLTSPYTSLGIYPKGFPILDQMIILARGKVNDAFKQQFNYSLSARRLLDQRNSRHDLIQIESDKVDYNLTQILAAAGVCYDTPAQCWKASTTLNLKPINAEVLAQPSFLFLCNLSLATNQADLRSFMTAFGANLTPAVTPPMSAKDCAALDKQAQNLTSLVIDGTNDTVVLNDLSPLTSLMNIQDLVISHAHIDDVIQLSSLLNLQTLTLNDNRISDLTPLADMTELKVLDLSSNDLEELTGIDRLHRLRKLVLRDNQIDAIDPLKKLSDLMYLDLLGNPVASDKKAMTDLGPTLSNIIAIFPDFRQSTSKK